MCERTFRRYVDRYEDEGLDGLAGEVSAQRAPADGAVRTETLYRERYRRWNVKHFHSFYRRASTGAGAWSVQTTTPRLSRGAPLGSASSSPPRRASLRRSITTRCPSFAPHFSM